MGRNKTIILPNNTAYLQGVKAVVTSQNKQLIAESAKDPQEIFDKSKNLRGFVHWGDDNDLPNQVMESVKDVPQIMGGMPFLVQLIYGDGIVYGTYKMEKGKKIFEESLDNKDINEFFQKNDINGYLLEQCNDIVWFSNVFPELTVNKDANKIVRLRHKEAVFSRWEAMNPENGLIENHFYTANWKDPKPQLVEDTPVLKPFDTVEDLQIRMGLIDDTNGKRRTPSRYRFIYPLNMPSPGRNYYQKPPWYSIIESGWLDFAKEIPEFKKALLANSMLIKYHVELEEKYFEKIFKSEGIKEPDQQAKRIKKEYADLEKFLKDNKNTGATVISFVRHDAAGKEVRSMKINVINNKETNQGGEYIQDSEEVSNIIFFALGVIPALIGPSPGKNKGISGTEARELFIIKQQLMKPIRDRLLRPLYIIKEFNKWPEEIHFAIPNLILTTLDRGTGSEKVIS